MYKLPLDAGIWSGEIKFQSSKCLNINQIATCQLEVGQSVKDIEANGTIRVIEQLEEYRFSFYITSFKDSSNMTTWHYKDSKYGNIWGKLVFIEGSYLILGISEDNENSFTLSIKIVDTTHKIVKGFTLYDRKNILSWSLHLNKLESSLQYQNGVDRPKNPKQLLKLTTVPLRGTAAS